MAVLLRNGAIFLHVPKTGGTWVTDTLESLGLVAAEISPKHADISRVLYRALWTNNPRQALRGFLAEAFLRVSRKVRLDRVSDKPFIFCFVRHPLSWYESWFKHMSQPARRWRHWGSPLDPRHWHPNSILNGAGSDDFNQFVRNVIRRRPGYVTELFGWYTTPHVDFVGKQENLANDLHKVLGKLDLGIDLSAIREQRPANVSPNPGGQLVWSEDLRQEVTRLEYAGLVRYGYVRNVDVRKQACQAERST